MNVENEYDMFVRSMLKSIARIKRDIKIAEEAMARFMDVLKVKLEREVKNAE